MLVIAGGGGGGRKSEREREIEGERDRVTERQRRRADYCAMNQTKYEQYRMKYLHSCFCIYIQFNNYFIKKI